MCMSSVPGPGSSAFGIQEYFLEKETIEKQSSGGLVISFSRRRMMIGLNGISI